MGDSTTTTTQSTTIPGIGGQEAGARGVLEELMSATGQLGDLSALANGQLQLSPSDTALLDQIQRLSGDASRLEMGRNLDFASSDLEEQLLARGVEGSSIEGLEQGLLRTEALHGLNQSSIEGQRTRAEQSRQQVFDRGNLQLNANQLILNRILQSAGGLSQMGLQERMAQPTMVQETTTPFDYAGMATSLGQIGAGIFAPGVGAAAGAAAPVGMQRPMQGPSPLGDPIG